MRPADKGPAEQQLIVDRGGRVRALPQRRQIVAPRRQPVRGRLRDRIDQRRASCSALRAQKDRLQAVAAIEIGQRRLARDGAGQGHFLRAKGQPGRRQRRHRRGVKALRHGLLRQGERGQRHNQCANQS